MSPRHSDTVNGTGIGRLVLAYFLVYVVWGSTYFFIGVALKGLPPFLLGVIRFSTAGILLLGLASVRRENPFRLSLVRKSAVAGTVLLFVDMAVVMLAQQYLESSLVAIIASSTAIWIMALDVPMWKTNFNTPAAAAGILTGFAGVALLFVEQLEGTAAREHGEYGILLLVFGCISWSLGTLYAKYRSSNEEGTNEWAGSAWQMLFAGSAFWICSCILGEPRETAWSDVPASAWYALAYLVVFGSILAYSSYIWLLKVRPASEVATHAYVNPLVAVLLGTMAGGERISGIQMAGLAAILASIVLTGTKRTGRPAPPRQNG